MASAASRIAERLRRTGLAVFAVLKATYLHWRASRTLRLGASIAYYSLFAFVPLLMLAAAVIGMVMPEENVTGFYEEILSAVGIADPTSTAESLASSFAESTATLGTIGLIAVLVSASFLILALQDALNVIWGAPVRVGLRNSIRRRLVAFSIALITAVFFAAGFISQSLVSAIASLLPDRIVPVESLQGVLVSAVVWAAGIITMTLLFRVLPYAEVAWRPALVGAAVTALLVALGTSLIGFYVSRYATSSLSAAAGAVVAFLVWLYLEAQIVLGGAVLTKVLQDRADLRPGAGRVPA